MADYISSHTGGQIDDAVEKILNLEQTPGAGTAVIMSQKAVTDTFSEAHEKYTVSVGTTWTLVGANYTQTIAVVGIKAANNYVCGLVPASVENNAIAQEEAFCHVNSITIADDSITLTAFPPAPITAFNLLILR
jgi:hypothetical protein